jgi:hypothetical protein
MTASAVLVLFGDIKNDFFALNIVRKRLAASLLTGYEVEP